LGGETESDGTRELSRRRFEGIRDVDAEVDAIVDLATVNKFGRRKCRRPRSIASAADKNYEHPQRLGYYMKGIEIT